MLRRLHCSAIRFDFFGHCAYKKSITRASFSGHVGWPPVNRMSNPFFYFTQGTYSIVLLAVVDSDYKFVIVDVGAYGKQSDGGVLEQSKFGHRLEEGKLHLPRDLALPNTSHSAPCVFVGDGAFQLRTDFLRPYPGRGLEGAERIFNYRLSRARRCAENAFGILATRWRILLRTMGEEPKQAEVVVKALCVLHNFLMHRRTGDEDSYCGPGFADSVDGFGQRRSGQWREKLVFSGLPGHFLSLAGRSSGRSPEGCQHAWYFTCFIMQEHLQEVHFALPPQLLWHLVHMLGKRE
ncbi:hypothetical protein MTO96_016969 [Rhipicephalus appendiculatus]